jgi:quercetin dioxygenase-like cupin family protein
MRRPETWFVTAVVMAGLAVTGAAVIAQEGAKPSHVMVMPADLKWGDPPPVFEKGMSFTVVAGDPGASGLFVVRLKMPAGYKIAPHWHPTDEHVTVLEGTLGLGMGDKLDKATLKELGVGGYALLPAQMHHSAFAKTATTVQVHGMGPFALTYINPADDPQTRAAAK